MTTATIRKKLVRFIERAESKKLKAMYTLFEDEIMDEEWEYSDEFKAELDRRYAYYQNGGKMVTAAQSERAIRKLLNSKSS